MRDLAVRDRVAEPTFGTAKTASPSGLIRDEDVVVPVEFLEREHGEVGREPGPHVAAVSEAEQVGLFAGDLAYCGLDGEIAAVAHVTREQQCGVACRAEHLEMRAGIARTHDVVRVGEELADLFDVGVRDADDHDTGAEIVLEHPVSQHVRRVTAARGNQLVEVSVRPRA